MGRSFCAASYSTSCPRAFPAFAISAGSPTERVQNFFRSAAFFSPSNPWLPPTSPHSGNACVAKGRCTWSNDSPLYRSSSRKPDGSPCLIVPNDQLNLALSAPASTCRLRCTYTLGKSRFTPSRARFPPTIPRPLDPSQPCFPLHRLLASPHSRRYHHSKPIAQDILLAALAAHF